MTLTLILPLPPVTRTLRQGHFAKALLCLAPLGFAAFITLDRVAAYKHDFAGGARAAPMQRTSC